MRRLFVLLCFLMSISIASAQSQRSYVYDATAYDLEGGGLSTERYVSKGRILGSTPILDISADKKIIRVKAGDSVRRFERGADFSNGYLYYYYSPEMSDDEATMRIIMSTSDGDLAADLWLEQTIAIGMPPDFSYFQILYYDEEGYSRHDYYNFSHYVSRAF